MSGDGLAKAAETLTMALAALETLTVDISMAPAASVG